ncbi:MAG TPA: hypothetical protein ENH19_01400 [Actinobacteria bacterium]|nr:hypothetical protein [Actinomycetes bacterium]HEX21292.1 hypothetical protein [Actinomycetota bacterium]
MFKKSLIVITAMSILLSLAGVAYSQSFFNAANQQTRPGQEQGSQRQRPRHRRGGKINRLMRRTMRGTIFIKGRDGKTQRLRIDRGKITSITDKLLTIKEMDGYVVRLGIDKDTKFAGKPLDQLQEGDPIGAIRRKSSGHYRTLFVKSRRGQKPNDRPPKSQSDALPPTEGNSLGI